ncbi:MAG TPA: VWA domain-containing protein [Candidatus Binataceae bacterium]|nr:VWA domain-containing protein [Candidatus Binataceae bacterium]
MARKSKPVKPRRLYIPQVPDAISWLESDSYDRRAWNEIRSTAPSLATLADSGGELIPHFDALLQDLFFSLFKYNLIFQKPDAVRRSAILNRTILDQLIPSQTFEALKNRTLLEEDKAAIAAIVLGEQVLEMVRGERIVNRKDMLDLWDLAHQEDDLKEKSDALKNVQEMQEGGKEGDGEPDAELKEKIAKLAEAAENAAKVSEARLNQKARQVESDIKNGDLTQLKRMELRAAELAGEIDQATEDSHAFSREFGQGGRMPAGERLELGRRLARNKKLGELARMVGRFKQDARAIRKRTLERGVAEAYDVERGADLGRMIPSELVAMHHPILRHDFHRRLLEGSILQYRLQDDEQKHKGPMVVCVDVSSSMEGQKELWSKAVSLTLMDIARRQRRLFRAVMFSSSNVVKVLDLNRERRYQPEMSKVMELAEFFPGGGTDFEAPIDAAMDLIEEKKLKRADIVIITDGECQVSDTWLAHLKERKDELDFSIFAVLVDVGSSEMSTLAQFSDRITSIKQLSAEGTRDIFLKVQGQ